MRPIVTDQVAWSVGLSVCLTVVNPAKTAEPIETPSEVWTQVGQWKHVLYTQGCTLALPGEYEWTVHVRRRCGFFVKLLWPLVDIATGTMRDSVSTKHTCVAIVSRYAGNKHWAEKRDTLMWLRGERRAVDGRTGLDERALRLSTSKLNAKYLEKIANVIVTQC